MATLLTPDQAIRRPQLPTTSCAVAVAALVIGCGGAHAAGGSTATPRPTATSTSAGSSTWTACAVEDGTCHLTGTNQVRFGLDGRYVTRTVTGPVACNNATFGDPYPKVGKACQYMPASGATPPATIPGTRCATDDRTCSVPGTARARDGWKGKYFPRTVRASLACANRSPGDADPGVAKACEHGSTGTRATSSTAPLPTDAIFTPTSFWYTPIPTSVTLAANSSAYVAEFLRQKTAYYGTVTINTYAYSSPLYLAPAGTATKTVKVWDCQNKGYSDRDLAAQWTAVPLPANAQASPGTDAEMSVYQPSTNTLWEFWQARNIDGQWHACWGGQMKNTAASHGAWPHPYGTTATGLPFIGGQITAEELKRGEIRHVIGIALVDLAQPGVFSWPATRSDGYNPNNVPNRIPQGTRFRLDPSVDVDARKMSAAARTIAKAAQKYGFVVWDKAGSISLRAENAISYTANGQSDPYPALYDGAAEWAVLDNFPWERLQFLPKDYGKH